MQPVDEPVASGSGHRSPSVSLSRTVAESSKQSTNATLQTGNTLQESESSTVGFNGLDRDAGIESQNRSDNKGKGRALSEAPQASGPSKDEMQRKQSPSSSESTDLLSHKNLLSSMLPSLTCQICLYLLHRPFTLAPCGHVACYSCLVSWFKSNGRVEAQEAGPPPQPPPADPTPNEEGAVNNNAQPPLPGNPTRARVNRATLYQKKTCPHCRATVRDRPTEVWAIKSVVSSIAKSGLVDEEMIPLELREGTLTNANNANGPAADPWDDVFPSLQRDVDIQRDDLGIRDAEDHVYRCIDCAHEILHGICSGCDRYYPGHADRPADFSDDEDFDEDMARMALDYFLGQGPGLGYPDPRVRPLFEPVSDDTPSVISVSGSDGEGSFGEGGSESSYEGSFIDDDEHHVVVDDEEGYEGSFIDDEAEEGHGSDSGSDSDGADAPHDILPHPIRRGISRAAQMLLSSDGEASENELSSEIRVNPSSHRAVRRAVVQSDEEEGEEEDAQLAEEVAARERAQYGDDGSTSRNRLHTYPSEDDNDDLSNMGDSDDSDFLTT
ncbi:hypothetical protein C8Q75DRAFT_454629 [Abortiporus biennis]|nr:hypothetical protein C8Q75DRAFT_454629 [Abortiporus biennis]